MRLYRPRARAFRRSVVRTGCPKFLTAVLVFVCPFQFVPACMKGLFNHVFSLGYQSKTRSNATGLVTGWQKVVIETFAYR
ncbi:MAG: hypothetical protein PSN37_03970 [Alphaproteobacteria bacterium]|nr:hypothetical protein [Alphaproteobacteria bacterium]